MKNILGDMPIFIEVVRQKNYTKAAESLDIPLSTVSRRIIEMEKKLGVPLFYRNARKVELTASGQLLFERCLFIVDEAEKAFEALEHNAKNPSGHVRISMVPDMYYRYLSGAFSAFAAAYPEIHLHVHLSERWVDLLTEPYDLDVRVGPLPDSTLKVRKLTTLKPGLYGSPKLFEFYPIPQKTADLSAIPCISISRQGNMWMMSKGKQVETVAIKSAHTANSGSVVLEFLLAGLGIGWSEAQLVSQYEKSGELIHLLPDWSIAGVDVNLVMASSQLPKRVRLFVDYLVEHFAGLPQ